MFGVYCIKNTLNGKCYVGVSSDIKNRFKTHIRSAKALENKYLLYEDMRADPISFVFSVVEECEERTGKEREKFWIMKMGSVFPNGYNKVVGGGLARRMSMNTKLKMSLSMTGRKHTEETKAKISAGNVGQERTEETRARMSCSAKRRPFTQQAIDALSKGRLGRICTEETRAKHSIRMTGNVPTDETIRKGAITQMRGCIIKCSNGKIYETARDAAADTGVHRSNVSNVMSGRQKTSRGFSFERVRKTVG
jgi:group I intron endonuclease